MDTHRFVVGDDEARLRLDRYLVRALPSTFSRGAIQRAIQAGHVRVDGQIVKAHRRLQSGQTVEAQVDRVARPSQQTSVVAESIPLDIVYEDDQFLVVNKPAGLVTHPAPGHWSGTLVNAIVWHLQQKTAQGSGLRVQGARPEPRTQNPELYLPRAGIVHRLDKDTSGLLLVAKTETALHHVAKQLKARTVSRRYVALVDGHLAFDEGTINASIGRHLKERKLMAVRYLGGRAAVSHYRVIRRLGQTALRYTVLEVSLETGRTHQVRVHLAHLGHPVLGDVVYGKRSARDWVAHGIARQLLHAYAIRFVHPATQHPVDLIAPIPDDMARWIPQTLVDQFLGRNARDSSTGGEA